MSNNKESKLEEVLEQSGINKLPQLTKELILYKIIYEYDKKIDKNNQFNIDYDGEPISANDVIELAKIFDVNFLKAMSALAMRDMTIKYRDVYKESLIHFEKILKNYKKLATELGIDSSLVLSNLFTYMLWNGYFSVTKNHEYNLNDRLTLSGMFFLDVIKGGGVCLSYSELLQMFLTTCEMNAACLVCYAPNRNIDKLEYRPEIERKVKKDNTIKLSQRILSSLLKRKIGNHVITLIEEDGNMYAYDPTNLCVLKLDDSDKASMIASNNSFNIKPLISLIGLKFDDPKNLLDKLISGNFKSDMTKEEFASSNDFLLDLLTENKRLLDHAYDNIHGDLEFINNQINEIGGKDEIQKRFK